MSQTKQPTPDERSALERELWAVCDQLPQRAAIDIHDARQWVSYMAAVRPEDAMWHMRRAAGIGGSEIGGLIRNHLGVRADYEFSAHDWALGKLLKRVPDEGNEFTKRGIVFEPHIRALFYEWCHARHLPSEFDRLRRAQGSLPWMRYSPDDAIAFTRPYDVVVQGEQSALFGRYVVDYKAPTTVDPEDRISFQYAAQLNQGGILCAEQEIDIDGLMLVQFDWARCTFKLDAIPVDRDLCAAIREAGNYYWSEVLNGRIPRYVVKEQLVLDDQLRTRIAPKVQRMAFLRGVQKRLEQEADAVRADIAQDLDLQNRRLGASKLTFSGAMNCSATPSINEDKLGELLAPDVIEACRRRKNAQDDFEIDQIRLASVLEEHGIPIDAVRRKRLDPVLVFSALEEAELDPNLVIKEAPVWRLARGVQAQVSGWVEGEQWFRKEGDSAASATDTAADGSAEEGEAKLETPAARPAQVERQRAG